MSWLNAKIPAGKYLNIPVYLHWSMLLMLGIFFWLGLLQGLAFLAAYIIVLIHEYGHCLVGRYYGYPTKEILLTPIGGVAMIQIPSKPKHELMVILGGPAVNVAFVPVLWAAGYLHPFFWLVGLYNVIMLVFNLIPALPLDGGRILRAILSMWWQNHSKATLVAGRIGQGIAVLFGLLGLLFGQPASLLIAIFVFVQAEREIQQAQATKVLTDNVSESLAILREAQRKLNRRR